MRERAPDLIGAALLVALGAAFAIGSLAGYEVINDRGRIGTGFMPFATGLLLVLFGAMIGVEALLRGPRDEEGGGGEDGSGRTVGFVFALTFAAILLIPVLGFVVSFGLLVFVLVWLVERGGLLLGAGMGIGAAAFTWLVFVFFLQIPLPGGIFGLGSG